MTTLNRAGRRRQKAALRRQQRVPSARAIEAATLYTSDNCSLCGRALRHGEVTRTGQVKGRWHVAGECCGSRIERIFALGVYHLVDQPEPAHVRDDREWFASNPRRTHRVRLAHADEAAVRGVRWVVVRQAQPGIRYRIGINLPFEPPDEEALAHALFDLLAEAAQAGRTKVPAADLYQRAMAMAQESWA